MTKKKLSEAIEKQTNDAARIFLNYTKDSISKQDESLQLSAQKAYYSDSYKSNNYYSGIFIDGALFGANWQQQKDKVIIDTLKKQLSIMIGNAKAMNNHISSSLVNNDILDSEKLINK